MGFKIVCDAENADRFHAQLDLSLPVAVPGVQVHPVEIDGHLKIMLLLDEDTTCTQIENSIPLALKWRDSLNKWQGIWLYGGYKSFLVQLDELQEQGVTYAELAERINKRVAEYLCQHMAFVKELESAKSELKTEIDCWSWLNSEDSPDRMRNSCALARARDLLTAVRFQSDECVKHGKSKRKRPNTDRPKDIEAILQDGLECISEGKPPFEKGYPIDRDRVIATLRSWRGHEHYRIVKAKEQESKC